MMIPRLLIANTPAHRNIVVICIPGHQQKINLFFDVFAYLIKETVIGLACEEK